MANKIIDKDQKREISIKFCFLAAIFWIATVVMICVIFHFSNQTGTTSSAVSGEFINIINEYLGIEIYDDGVVRLFAHAVEFAILTFLSYMALSSTNKISDRTSYSESPVKLMRSDNEMNIIFTLWFAILNAIFDEYHQLFVIGRAGRIFNVLIDIIGIVIVLIIIRVVFSIYLKTKGKNEVVYT